MKIQALNKHDESPTVFSVTLNGDESRKGDIWLKNEIKYWCGFPASCTYKGFNWDVKSMRRVYQKPHIEVTFHDNKKKIFVIYQAL